MTENKEGSWHRVEGKHGKRQHFVLKGENFSLCKIHESHFGLGKIMPNEKKQCKLCIRVLETYNNFNNRTVKPIPTAKNYRSKSDNDFEFKWDGSRRYY